MTTVDKSTKVYSTFDPRIIPGCTLWLDANDSSSITKSGSNITTWRDKSGSGFSATNGSSTGPTTTTTTNRTYVTFNGTTNFLQTSLTLTTNNHSFMLVYKPSSLTKNSLLRAQATAGYIVFPYYTAALKNAYITSFDGSGAGSIDSANSNLDPSASTSQFNVVTITIATGAQAIFNNGTSQATNTQTISSTTSDAFYIGAWVGTSQFFQGDVGEILIFNRAVTSTERVQIEGYLAWKWGLQANLDVGHTYISRGPTLSYFRPSDISNCDIWFDAADVSTITGTTTVTAWKNKGSITMNAINATGSCTSGNSYNGLNYIASPAGTEMRFTCAITAQSRTWFVVARNKTTLTTAPNYWAFVNQTAGSGQDGMYAYNNGTGSYTFLEGPSGSATGYIRTDNLTNPYLVVNLITSQHSTTSSENYIGVNGNSYFIVNNVAASGYATTSLAYSINTAVYNTASDYFEIIHYNASLTTQQRQTVEGYLAWKWGLSSNLPSTHPYKTFYPLKVN